MVREGSKESRGEGRKVGFGWRGRMVIKKEEV